MIRALLLGLTVLASATQASPYDPLIDAAAYRHGVDPIVLRAIVQKETRKQPWAFNTDGEGFYFDSKQAAITALWQISRNPWLVKINPHTGKEIRQFFPNPRAAQAFLNHYHARQQQAGLKAILQRHDDYREVKRGEARIRKLWTVNTDIGIAQINYRFHGIERARVQQWFDPAYNLNYAASLVASHKRSGKSDLEAAGDYHSKTPSVRAVYLSALRPIYQSEKKRAIPALAIN